MGLDTSCTTGVIGDACHYTGTVTQRGLLSQTDENSEEVAFNGF